MWAAALLNSWANDGLVSAASLSAMERTELKMALIAEQLGLSWAGECEGLNALLSPYKHNA